MRVILLGLLLLLAACTKERQGYEISATGVATYVWDPRYQCWGCTPVRVDVGSADPKTFVQLSSYPAFGKDALHAFYEDQIIDGADLPSFRQLGNSKYSADKQAAFFEASRVAEADVATFRALFDDFAVDANNTFLRGSVIPGARGALTEIPYNGYLRDETNQIFYQDCLACPISQVDACDGASFVAGIYLRQPEAWDNLCVYADAKRLPLTDRASYRYLGNRWSKDAGGVYFGSDRLDGADPVTFTLVKGDDRDTIFGGDASGRCWYGTRSSSCPANPKPYTDPTVPPPSAYTPPR